MTASFENFDEMERWFENQSPEAASILAGRAAKRVLHLIDDPQIYACSSQLAEEALHPQNSAKASVSGVAQKLAKALAPGGELSAAARSAARAALSAAAVFYGAGQSFAFNAAGAIAQACSAAEATVNTYDSSVAADAEAQKYLNSWGTPYELAAKHALADADQKALADALASNAAGAMLWRSVLQDAQTLQDGASPQDLRLKAL